MVQQLSSSPSINDNNINDSSSNKVVSSSNNIIDKAPSLNGKILLPLKAILVGLGQHMVAAVYAILLNYTKNDRGGVEGSSSDGGWEKVVHIGITKDLFHRAY